MGKQKSDAVGLPMSESSDVLATKAAEAELAKRVETLQEQLRSATKALERLRSTGESSSQRKIRPSKKGIATIRPSEKGIAPPPGKRGYLFKWLDRSIGVSRRFISQI
jgi:hypothetical protein